MHRVAPAATQGPKYSACWDLAVGLSCLFLPRKLEFNSGGVTPSPLRALFFLRARALSPE